MRLVGLPFVALLVAACGDVGTAERLSSKETLDGIDVPTIGTVGDFPDPARRFVVHMKADGTVVLDGTTYATYSALRAELRRRADLVPGDFVPGVPPPRRLSDACAVLRVDGAAPWGAAQRLAMACAEEWIWRLSFAVRPENGGPEGVLGFDLPKDKGCDGPHGLVWKNVDVVAGGGGSPALLFAALTQSPSSETGKLGVSLDPDPRLPTRVVLSMIDASIRVGSAAIEVACDGPPRTESEGEFVKEAARLRTDAVGYELRLAGKVLSDATAARPFVAVARVHGTAAIPGFGVKRHRVETDELGDPIAPASAPK